jgi:hypothetical protein
MLVRTLPDHYSLVVPFIFEKDSEQPDDVIVLMNEFWSSGALVHWPMLAWVPCLSFGVSSNGYWLSHVDAGFPLEWGAGFPSGCWLYIDRCPP